MVSDSTKITSKPSSLRWKIIRQALLPRPSSDSENQSEIGLNQISRKTRIGFNLIPCCRMNNDDLLEENSDSVSNSFRDACYCYILPVSNAPKLFIHKRVEDCVDLKDFETCNRYGIDNTGLVFLPQKTCCRGLLQFFLSSSSAAFLNNFSCLLQLPPSVLFPKDTPQGPPHASTMCRRLTGVRYVSDTTTPALAACQWPSEDVLAYYCLSHVDMFRSKRVIELGSGYGLAGLVIGMVSDALEVVISDGNPQVVDS
ncbi:uncharacterized protein LOC111373971 isoform X3 [Olea europaea var. sylvestris]|uniref:uncharacterized protein LOC111373971 isoform X3 n=1 Tax=Olea europaea var. sylvestris TaxID=158386 RepID=UPI000C1D3CF5|nr:uncharacterized protein LOC111373971 isoform X3 [Olea europaea var. sylvestris]